MTVNQKKKCVTSMPQNLINDKFVSKIKREKKTERRTKVPNHL